MRSWRRYPPSHRPRSPHYLQAGFGLLHGDRRIEAGTEKRLRYWIEEYKNHPRLWCVIYRPDGTLVAGTAGLAENGLPPPPAGGGDRWLYDAQVPGIGRQRVMAERIQLGGQEYVVILLAPLEAVDRELEQLRGILLMAGPAALLLSAGLAYGLARE